MVFLAKQTHVEGRFSQFMKPLLAMIVRFLRFGLGTLCVHFDRLFVLLNHFWAVTERLILDLRELVLRPKIARNALDLLPGL
jgi:hypothetical protein